MARGSFILNRAVVVSLRLAPLRGYVLLELLFRSLDERGRSSRVGTHSSGRRIEGHRERLTRLQLRLVKDDPSGSLLDTKGAPEREVGRLLQDRNHSLVGLAILELLGAWLMNGQACTRASEPSLPVGETIGPSLDISFYFRTGTAPEGLYVSDTFLPRGVEFIEE